MNRLDRFFEVTARGSTVGAEIRGGVVTFIAMAYIIVLNPIILSGSADVAGNKLQFALWQRPLHASTIYREQLHVRK